MTTSISVIVCTRDRPDGCGSALRSILIATAGQAEVLVIDQSCDDRTARIVEQLAGGVRLRHIRSRRVGLSSARNEGIAAAGSEFILFTDDDCLVDPSWFVEWSCALGNEPRLGVAFGTVKSPPHNTAGYTSTFETRPGTYVFGRELFLAVMRGQAPQVGMGANMLVSRRAWIAVAGFDEALGAGGRFPAAEEVDFAYRVAAAGYRIAQVSIPMVWHLGCRTGVSASRLVCGYAAGSGAMYAKHVRCGDRYAARLLFLELRLRTWNMVRHVVALQPPFGLGALAAYLHAIVRSASYRLDPDRRCYVVKESRDAA